MADTTQAATDGAPRRDFLMLVTGAFAAVGVGAIAWPFIASLQPAKDTLALASGVIIGTHFKVDGITWNAVDGARVKCFMDKVESLR